jgi:hypothetical protein
MSSGSRVFRQGIAKFFEFRLKGRIFFLQLFGFFFEIIGKLNFIAHLKIFLEV